MGFAKLPTQAPQWDATAFTNWAKSVGTKLGLPFPLTANPTAWKRWVEATAEQDAVGLRDVVNANALGLDDIKKDTDSHSVDLADLKARVSALEAAPATPFPASGLRTVSQT